MAVGDTVADTQSIATTAYLTIQPTGTAEWVIHNIYAAADVEIYKYDGTDEVLIDSSTGQNSWLGYAFHVTNSHYIRIKNTNAASKVIGYDGIITHT